MCRRTASDIEGLAGAGHHDLAAVHDREVVGQLVGELEILLDQQDRHVAALAQIDDGAADILDDRGLDAFGRLVEHQQLGPHGERAADRELLLLAARQIAAAAAQHRLQHREELEHLVRHLLVLAAAPARSRSRDSPSPSAAGRSRGPAAPAPRRAARARRPAASKPPAPSSGSSPTRSAAGRRSRAAGWSCRRRCGRAGRSPGRSWPRATRRAAPGRRRSRD